MALFEGRVGWLFSQCQTRGRVVVVVGGVMSIPGDGNAVHKAKDHSHGYFGEEMLSGYRGWCSLSEESSLVMESRMR